LSERRDIKADIIIIIVLFPILEAVQIMAKFL
jgi:nitrate reductase NapE component